MENEIVIKQDKTNETLTFQAKGEIEFLENITNLVISNFNNSSEVDQTDFVKAYDPNSGYIGKTVDITKEKKKVPEHFKTGIKKRSDEPEKYKCRYICPKCGTKENKYLYLYSEYMYCRVCNEKLSVTWIADEYNNETDEYNNFAFAGKFQPRL